MSKTEGSARVGRPFCFARNIGCRDVACFAGHNSGSGISSTVQLIRDYRSWSRSAFILVNQIANVAVAIMMQAIARITSRISHGESVSGAPQEAAMASKAEVQDIVISLDVLDFTNFLSYSGLTYEIGSMGISPPIRCRLP